MIGGEVIIIAAVAKNGVIGSKGQIPWHIPDDFRHFKELTMGWPCVMGDVTYASLPKSSRPLPGRENVVLTFKQGYHPKGTTVFHEFDTAIKYCREKYEKVYITGGATIYRISMDIAHKLEITLIDKDYDGDTFFPTIDMKIWREEKRIFQRDEKQQIDYSFVTYVRR